MILVLNMTKQVITWELTVSWEENMSESHERKFILYQEFVEQCKMKERHAHCDPTEIVMGQSLCKALTKLGVAGRNKKDIDQVNHSRREKGF